MDRPSLTQLQQTIAQSRDVISHRSQQLREQINVKKRVSHAVQQKPWLWVGLAAGIGFIFQSRFSRKSTSSREKFLTPTPKKTSLVRTLLWSVTTTLARPYLQNLAKTYISRFQQPK